MTTSGPRFSSLAKFYPARNVKFLSPYEKEVLIHVMKLGGFYNAHAHLDRADTIGPEYLEHIHMHPLAASMQPLSVKQNLVGDLHNGLAYTEDDLRERMSRVIERLIAFGTTRLDTNIDATPDLPEDGLLAIRIANEIKVEYADRITIRIAPTNIFGFKEHTARWEVFKEAAKNCDYLSGLPEKDDYLAGTDPKGKIGFRRAIRMILELGAELGMEVQFHLDQANDPNETGTEKLLDGLQWVDAFVLPNGQPSVWIVHMISPSARGEDYFRWIMERLRDHNVGVVFCTSAGISMRQLRPIVAPTHNSLARVAELIKMDIPIRIGSDNICDLFVPQCTGEMLTEVIGAGNAIRYATPSVWAKIATGTPLNNVDIADVGRSLYEDHKAFRRVAPGWISAID